MQILIQQVWGGAWEPTFQTGSQVMSSADHTASVSQTGCLPKLPRMLIKYKFLGTTPDQINLNLRRKASLNTTSGMLPQLHIKITWGAFNNPDAQAPSKTN